jgi:hypothetical protein
MIAMTNANMRNLPTTPAPAPEKSWDKQDRAKAAAIKELGPQAIPGFDFDVYKCDGRWLWRAIAADKRPPVSDAQVKANGGKRAVDAMVSAPDRLAGEAVTAAAVEKIMAASAAKRTADKIATELMGTPAEKLALEIAEKAGARLAALDTTEDANGVPAFLKRDGDKSVEAQEALVAKHKKTTGPDRVIKNPPDAGKAKEKAKKEKKATRMFVATSAILAGKDNEKALAEVLSVFPTCDYKTSDMQWVRRKLIREGKMKNPTVKTGKSK